MFFKKKPGTVYFGESTRKDSSKKIYTGITRRPVKTRWGKHIKSQSSSTKKTWVSKGTYFRPMGTIKSSNPEKAEKTIKKLPPHQKKYLARGGAKKYYRKKA